MLVSTAFALSGAPCLASQRGLSGTKNIAVRNSSDGTAVTANIQRQPTWPFHEFRISLAVAVGEMGLAMSQFTTCASRMPHTIVSWFMETSFPRRGAGASSAMYTGE